MTNSNLLKLIFIIFKWFLVVFFALAIIGAISEKGYISAFIFLLIILLVLPLLSEFWKSKLPILSNKLMKGGLLVVLFFVGMGMFPNLDKYKKPKEETKPEEVVKESPKKVEPVKETANGNSQYDADGNLVGVSNEQEVSGSNSIQGLKPVDIYGSFQKKGFSLDKEIGTDGSIFTNKNTDNGIDYLVETYCESGINDVTSIRLTATRINPQYNKVADMKPFLKFGGSVPYEGADSEKINAFIDQNYNKNKSSIVISGVKFTIYCPTEFMRMMDIEAVK